MVDIEIVEQKPISLVDLKEKLSSIKTDKELNFRANKVYNYLGEFTSSDKKSGMGLQKKLSDMGIQKLKDRHIIKIVDIQPEDQDSLKAIFVGETATFKQEELKKILDVVND